MSNLPNFENSEHDIFDPFPEPRTIPSGWHLPDSASEAEPSSVNDTRPETVNLHPILLCLN